MNNILKIKCFIIATAISGCASPLVKYGEITKEDKDGLAKFAFAESVVKFDLRKGPAPAFVVEGVDIVSVPVPESSGKRYFISGTSGWENWGVETTVSPSYRGDSPLLKTITLSTEDKRPVIIGQAIGILTKAAPFLVSASDIVAAKLPEGIPIQSLLDECDSNPARCSRTITFPDTSDYTADIKISAPPVDSFSRPIIKDSVLKSGSFIYSSCRQVDIKLLLKTPSGSSRVADSTVMVSDSKRFQTLAFPEKGTMTAGASCGASSAADASDLPGLMSTIDSLIGPAQTLAKAFKDAKDAKDAKK